MTTWPTYPAGAHEIQVESVVAGRQLPIWSWMESHSSTGPTPGPHLAINGIPQAGGTPESLVVHLQQVPALPAALTAAAAHLAQVWERDGAEYWERQQPASSDG